MYIGDLIGEEYIEWEEYSDTYNVCYDKPSWDDEERGSCIFISSATGSGKTHFILNKWLEYMMRRRKSILYLVNRSILKDDIKEKIAEKKMEDPNISNFIDVKLYQELENDLKGNEKEAAKNGGEGKKEKDGAHAYKGMETDSMKYDCVVCDECHYFLTDSNYNVDTSLSFRWVQDCFSHKVRIFMSATIDDIMAYIWAYDYDWKWGDGGPKYYLCKPELEKWKGGNGKIGSLPLRSKYYEYPMEKNYKYIDIHIRDNKIGRAHV